MFTDTETTTGNTFTAGIIDLTLTSDGTVTVDGSLDDMKPCQTGYLVITLTNGTAETGHNEMHVWKHIYNVTPDENGTPGPELAWYAANPTYDPKNDIDRYIHFDMWIDNDDDPYDFAGSDVMLIPESEGWLLSDNQDVDALFPIFPNPGTLDFNGVSCYWIYLGVLAPGDSMVIVQSFHLDAGVDNWAQSDQLTFTEDFFAIQTVGLTDAEAAAQLPSGSELPGHGIEDWS